MKYLSLVDHVVQVGLVDLPFIFSGRFSKLTPPAFTPRFAFSRFEWFRTITFPAMRLPCHGGQPLGRHLDGPQGQSRRPAASGRPGQRVNTSLPFCLFLVVKFSNPAFFLRSVTKGKGSVGTPPPLEGGRGPFGRRKNILRPLFMAGFFSTSIFVFPGDPPPCVFKRSLFPINKGV